MAIIRTIVGTRLRAEWKLLTALIVLGGLGFGAAATTIAVAARRTDSSYRRIADAGNVSHYEFTSNMSPDEFAAALATHPDHGLGDVRQWVGIVDAYNSYGINADTVATFGPGPGIERPIVLRGQLPVAANEMFINEVLAELTGLDVGDVVQRGVLTSNFDGVVDQEFVVTSVGVLAAEQGLVDDTRRVPLAMLTAAFVEENPGLISWYGSGARVDEPLDRVEVGRRLARAEDRIDGLSLEVSGVSLTKEQSARLALRPSITGLLLIGGLGMVAAVAVIGFTLGRTLDRWTGEQEVLRAIGAPRRLLRRLDATLVVVVLSGVAAVGVGTLLFGSLIGPIGEVRRLEPDTGLFVDPFTIGILLVAVAISGLLGLASHSRNRSTPRALRSVDDFSLKMVVGTSASSHGPIGIGLMLGAIGLAASSAILPYVTSLGALVDEPARYGQAWDSVVRNRWGDQAPNAIADIAASDLSIAVATITHTNLTSDGASDIPSAAYEVIEGPDLMTITTGRSIEGVEEAVAGAETLEQLGIAIGDTLRIGLGTPISFGVPGPSDRTAEVTIVGEAIFPSLTLPGASVPRLDEGLAVTQTLYDELQNLPDEPEITLVLTDSPQDAEELQTLFPLIEDVGSISTGTRWFFEPRPAEIRNAADTLPMLWVGLAVLVMSSTAVLGLALRTVLAAQRRDIAILRAIGATRAQIRRIAWKQGAALLIPIVLVGIPVGLAVGRLLYTELAKDLGVVTTPSTPYFATLGFVAATVGVCVIAGIFASRSVGDVSPAVSLRVP